MKARLSVLAIILTCAVSLTYAQPRLADREISLGFGVGPMIPGSGSTLGGAMYNIDFSKLLSDYFVVGGSVGISGNRLWHWGQEDTKTRFAMLTAAFRSNYVSEQYFKCYVQFNGGIAYGVFFDSDKDYFTNRMKFAWNVSTGMEFGDLYVFFIEYGVGNRGALLAGMRFRF